MKFNNLEKFPQAPADFTPVCTSEFLMAASMHEKFTNVNCALLGISVDSVASHNAWKRNINENIDFKGMRHVRVSFPIVDDSSKSVVKQYGMIQPHESETKAVRSVFFIDPKSVVRAYFFYPLAVGRNFHELFRVLIAMQTADAFNVATPANWQPGDAVLVPVEDHSCSVVVNPRISTTSSSQHSSTHHQEQQHQQIKEELTCYESYFVTKSIDIDTLFSTIRKKYTSKER